jgi:sialate O-acetylesterase
MKTSTLFLIILLTLSGCQKTPSRIKLPSLIGDNMLLQQKTDAKIWGKASPGKKIKVSASWNVSGETKSGENGKWTISLPTPEAGGPYTMTVSAKDTTITINNILVGDVWFCSGQSNMEMPMAGWPPVDTIMHSAETIKSASIPEIRLFVVQRMVSGEPLEECVGKWEVSSPASVNQFSATAFFFGKRLYEELHKPIGLIESAWGGTPSEAWTSGEWLRRENEFIEDIKAIKESAPLIEEYQKWLNGHKQLDVKPAGDDQWKNLGFGDENIPAEAFDDSRWPSMQQPKAFESVLGEFDGAVWFRKTVDVPQNMAGKDLILSLGPIDDMDITFFNGKYIGSNEQAGVWQLDRNYTVPASLVKAGANIIAVRVLDTQGGGGLWGKTGQLKLSLKANPSVSVSLEGEWKYQPVAELLGSKFYLYDITANDFSGRKRPKSVGPGTATSLYNGMVNPVLPYKIKGAIWYQGEANVGRADQYAKIFPAMIENWREAWGIKDFPFYFVQIAPYVYSGLDSSESAFLREAQESALKLPNTGMALTSDIATVMNIHPPKKKEVGERLASIALAKDYGVKIPFEGPVYNRLAVEGNTMIIAFDNIEGGLVSKSSNVGEFQLAGEDRKYYKANAKIVNDAVEVSSPNVKKPVSVRYCWRNGSEATLFNKAGLPARQFRINE